MQSNSILYNNNNYTIQEVAKKMAANKMAAVGQDRVRGSEDG